MTDDREVGTQRLDAFVDAAFAFAVSLLVISGEPPSSMAELRAALLQVPAFAAGCGLVLVFWLGHRDYGRLVPRRDAVATVLSLGIVFTVLVYVYPLRLLTQNVLAFFSGGLLPGARMESWGDLATLYAVYGAGFFVLSSLFVALFLHALRTGAVANRDEARVHAADWAIVASSGLLSAALAATPLLSRAPWLPGMAYTAIPLAIHLRARLQRRRTRSESVP